MVETGRRSHGPAGTPLDPPGSYLARGRPRILAVSEQGHPAQLMVGPLRGPEHLALVHRHRYYHLPAGAIAPGRAAVAYIAFYEGAGPFGRESGCIREYAPVERVARVRRRDLPGLTWPGRQGPEALYLRFDLGPIRQLPRPIANPDRQRVVFRFSDLDRLQAGRTLRDLSPSPRRGSGS